MTLFIISHVNILFQVIKFIDPSVEVPLRAITAIDRGIVELKSGVENMEAQVDDLNRRIAEYGLVFFSPQIMTEG